MEVIILVPVAVAVLTQLHKVILIPVNYTTITRRSLSQEQKFARNVLLRRAADIH